MQIFFENRVNLISIYQTSREVRNKTHREIEKSARFLNTTIRIILKL